MKDIDAFLTRIGGVLQIGPEREPENLDADIDAPVREWSEAAWQQRMADIDNAMERLRSEAPAPVRHERMVMPEDELQAYEDRYQAVLSVIERRVGRSGKDEQPRTDDGRDTPHQ